MTIPGVDPTALHNYAIRWAATNGHLDIVKYLITIPGVDPTAQDHHAIRGAAANKHEEIIKILARTHYNPFEQSISQEKKEERRKKKIDYGIKRRRKAN